MQPNDAKRARAVQYNAPNFFKVVSKYVTTSPHLDALTKLKVQGLLRSRSIASLAELGCISDEAVAVGADTLELRQIAALFKKNAAFADSKSCTAQATSTFHKAEELCRRTNKRITHFELHPERLDPKLRGYIDAIKAHIAASLGPLEELFSAMGKGLTFTSGATEDLPRTRSHAYRKFSRRLRCYPGMVPVLSAAYKAGGGCRSDISVTPVRANRVSFVPKNYKTHRTIGCEATHAIPFQLTIDKHLKAQILSYFGVDLSDQTRNQELARLGSIDGSYSTIDLRMASDTLALMVICALLPWRWANFLARFRASEFRLPDGETGTYAKFSSMGNGLTFSLETLIFSAVCKAVGGTFSVYGDDIIVERERTQSVISLLKYLGFTCNSSKTFTNPDLRFRESCGADWLDGRRVTPFYSREIPGRRDHSGWSHLFNGLCACTSSIEMVAYLAQETRRCGICVVPFNDDSRSGVFVDAHTAWRFLICKSQRNRDSQPYYQRATFRGYRERGKTFSVRGLRPYLLWHASDKDVLDNIHMSASRRKEVQNIRDGITTRVHLNGHVQCETVLFTPSALRTPASAYLMADALFAS